MRTAINLVSIKDSKILLCLKKDVWILPGGKPLRDETDLQCLERELLEELPDADIEIGHNYGDFEGQTPHNGDTLCATVYLGTIDGDITPAQEIIDARYFSRAELDEVIVSDITTQIITSLIEANLLK